MTSTSKRPRDEDSTPDLRPPCCPLDGSDPEIVMPPRKVAKISPKTDFSTFEIGRALDMPSVLPPPQVNSEVTADVEPPTQTASNSAESEWPDSQSSSQAAGTHGDLIELLDLSQLDSMSAIEARFGQIAFELMHNYRIEVKSAKGTDQLEVLEVEFYLYKSGCHEDPFTHASPEQGQRGRWYFHRPPARSSEPGSPIMVTPSGYRGGTRKGLDVTLGRAPPAMTSKFFPAPPSSSETTSSEGSDIVRGGALFRSARRVSDGHVISGPSLLVDEVLRLSGAKEIAELVAVHWNGDISAFPPPDTPSDPSPSPSPSSSSVSVLDTAAQLRRLPPSTTGAQRERLSTMYFVRAPPPAHPRAEPQCKEPRVDGRPRIFRSPRIGLDLSHASIPSPSPSPSSSSKSKTKSKSESESESLRAALAHPRVAYIARPYRFFLSPHLLTYNGRGQSFVGVHDALVARGHCERNDRELLGGLVRLTGIKGPTATKYLMELRLGLEQGELGDFTGPKGRTVAASVTGWLRMIGTLRRLGVGGRKQKQKGREGDTEEEAAKPGPGSA